MTETTTIERTIVDTDITIPQNWLIILHNDDVTPMNYVVALLRQVFRYDTDKAVVLMQTTHEKGQAIVGSYPYEVAEQKLSEAHQFNEMHQQTLKITMEQG